MVYTDLRQANHTQRTVFYTRSQVRNDKLAMALQVTKSNIEDPLTPDEISDLAKISAHQMERLFAKDIGVSPKRYYLSLRLERARDLLCQTDLSMTNVCIACGFKSLSDFSKSYCGAYGINPDLESGNTRLIWQKGA